MIKDKQLPMASLASPGFAAMKATGGAKVSMGAGKVQDKKKKGLPAFFGKKK